MPVIQLIVGLIVVGVILWLINTFIPMDNKIRKILNVVVVIVVVLYVLGVFGLFDPIFGFRITRY